MNTDAKIPQQNTSKPNSAVCLKDYTPDQVGFMHGMQG